MSCYEWERAEVELPSAAAAQVGKALRDHVNDLHEKARKAAGDFWTNYAKCTRSARLYRERLDAYAQSNRTSHNAYWSTSRHVSGFEHPLFDQLIEMLEQAVEHPHKLTVAEVEKFFPRASNRTNSFALGWEGAIALNGRKLTWSIPENNHAVEHAHEHPTFGALMSALQKVAWTRGSGGTSWGSDEYAQDAAREQPGYNPVSIKGAWGPAGEAARRREIDPYGMMDRTRRSTKSRSTSANPKATSAVKPKRTAKQNSGAPDAFTPLLGSRRGAN